MSMHVTLANAVVSADIYINQSKFKCRKCGFQLNADLNASKNIVLKYLDATGYLDWATVNLPNGGPTAANVPA